MLSNTKRKKETCVAKKAVVHLHERCILYLRARIKRRKENEHTKKKDSHLQRQKQSTEKGLPPKLTKRR